MRESAPVLCNRSRGFPEGTTHSSCPSGVRQSLHVAYAAWAEHHGKCPTCSEHDWYMPGDVCTRVDDILAHGAVEINGERVTYRRAPDLTVLCGQGARLLVQWLRAVVEPQPKKKRGQPDG